MALIVSQEREASPKLLFHVRTTGCAENLIKAAYSLATLFCLFGNGIRPRIHQV